LRTRFARGNRQKLLEVVDGKDCGLNCSAPLCGAACRETRFQRQV
jgi:hypothetical protein